MKVYQVVFEKLGEEGKEIEREEHFWTAPSLFAATAEASAHAYEYEKSLISVRYALTVVRDVSFKRGQKQLEQCLEYGLLEGEGKG